MHIHELVMEATFLCHSQIYYAYCYWLNNFFLKMIIYNVIFAVPGEYYAHLDSTSKRVDLN